MHNVKRTREDWMNVASVPGNEECFSASAQTPNENSTLKGKTILFLGSSVTLGAASCSESFADYLEKIDGIHKIKEAVNGTTLVNDGIEKRSYIERMLTMDKTVKADAFICQLSTNDATKQKTLGTVSEGFDREKFDISTIAGAIEYIISYAKETWNCPVYFYTGARYDSRNYAAMVARLYELKDKWDIGVFDLWSDDGFNAISDEERKLYMADPIHPTRAGYMKWWCPEMERQLKVR